MNIIKSLTAILLITICQSITAQGVDWQTSGGGSSQRIYRESSRQPSTAQSTIWTDDEEERRWGIVFGYVNKQWISEYGTDQQRENLFGERDKRLHGMQVGFLARPKLSPFVGIHTGAFYEAYFSSSDKVKEYGWDRFTEHDIYIPLHMLIELPLARTAALSIHGGIGFQWAISGEYRMGDWLDDYYDYDGHYYGPREYQHYGNGWPHHVNWQAECGIDFRIKAVKLGFTYSYGLTNHRLYNADYDARADKSRQDKMAFTLGFMF